jgi:hypothetical protein
VSVTKNSAHTSELPRSDSRDGIARSLTNGCAAAHKVPTDRLISWMSVRADWDLRKRHYVHASFAISR